ncbi:class F sortase [Streptomyces fuscichromogenes]|uniref:Class F sortase n=1 Tax=Streptomyces fuscichromogenes TaxID=1324013 RepID=A0A917XGK5_9ACTN|nr:class F sortase [Streptomyces fuscichromogenes]GGN21240.1 class F sortase [Streptomyces fuscichromogenes]
MAAGPTTPNPDDREGPDGQGGPAGSPRGGRLPVWGIAVLLLAVTLIGGHSKGSAAAGSSPAGITDALPSADPLRSGEALPRSTPTRLLIPKIAVDAPFTALTMGSTGQLEPPPADNTNLVGWYSRGAAPGEAGTSIIAGHVDTKTGPAVFVRLDELERGDRFTVSRADGTDANFVVDAADTFAKDDFPSDRVYADTRRPEVRLITCAGDYDHDVKDYTENLVVFGHLI